jgi:hypothetical protein
MNTIIAASIGALYTTAMGLKYFRSNSVGVTVSLDMLVLILFTLKFINCSGKQLIIIVAQLECGLQIFLLLLILKMPLMPPNMVCDDYYSSFFKYGNYIHRGSL